MHADAEGLVVAVDGGPMGGWATSAWDADPGEDGADDLLAEHDQGGDGAGGLGWDVVAVPAAGFGDQVVAAEFAQVVCRLADCVVVAAGHGVDFVGEVGDAESLGEAARAVTAAKVVRVRCWSRSMPPTRVRPMVEGWGSWSRIPSGRKATSRQSNGGAEPIDHAGQASHDVGEAVQDPSQVEGFGVVADRLESQHVLAFAVALERQGPEVDLEDGQAIGRCLDHGRHPGRQVRARGAGSLLVPKRVRSFGTSRRERVRSTTASKTRSIWAPEAKSRLRLYSTW